MDFIHRFLQGKTVSSSASSATQSYKYSGTKPPQKPLTPREIEELHAKLHPEIHQTREWSLENESLDPEEWKRRFLFPLDEAAFVSSGQPTSPQAQSLLFSRLPRELRMQIWSYAMGSHKLYLTVKNGRLAQATKMDDFRWWKKSRLLSIPLLCRTAYVESIGYLYASNTFCIGFGDEGTKKPITMLQSLLREQHIASIRKIELGWHFVLGYSNYFDSHPQAWDVFITVCAPDNKEDWHTTCAELAQLPRLKTLKIALWSSGDRRAELANQEEALLAPLVKISHLERFDVLLPWMQTNADLWTHAPFRVSRQYRDNQRSGVSIPLSGNASSWPS